MFIIFNYEDVFSIVLLSIVDANCKFIYFDTGSYGKEGDCGIFSRSSLYKLIKEGNYFPPNETLFTSICLCWGRSVLSGDIYDTHGEARKDTKKPF